MHFGVCFFKTVSSCLHVQATEGTQRTLVCTIVLPQNVRTWETNPVCQDSTPAFFTTTTVSSLT